MSSKSDAARNALSVAAAGGMFRAKPVQTAEPLASNVVQVAMEENRIAGTEPKLSTTPAGTVRATAKRVMLYLPPKAKKKFKEMAFHEERKEHDVYLEALRAYLESKGHKGFL